MPIKAKNNRDNHIEMAFQMKKMIHTHIYKMFFFYESLFES